MQKRTLVSFDWAIKRLLRQKVNFDILEGFLTELLKVDVTIKQMLESESNKNSEDDKYNRVDMLCMNSKEELIIIELQFYSELDYFQRMLYAASKFLVDYMDVGFDYSKVKKIYSINILYFDLGHGDDYIYHGKMEFTGVNKSDMLALSKRQQKEYEKRYPYDIYPEYYIIKINNFNNVSKNTLDEWIYFLKNTEVPDNYSAKGLAQVENKLKYEKMRTVDKKEYEFYLKNVRVSESAMRTAVIEAKLEEKIEIVLKGYENDLSISMISNITGLPEEEVVKILKENGREL